MNGKGRRVYQTLLYEIRTTLLFSINVLFSYINIFQKQDICHKTFWILKLLFWQTAVKNFSMSF